MSIDATALETIVRTVWESLSPLELLRADAASRPADSLDVVGWVAISGAWDGVVTLRTQEEIAHRLAAGMFGGEPPIAEEDLADAWGEVANMVGGWVKAATDGQSILSLPTVVRGSSLLVPDGRLAAACDFHVGGNSLAVRLIERGSTVRRARSTAG